MARHQCTNINGPVPLPRVDNALRRTHHRVHSSTSAAQLVDETEPQRAVALTDAITSAVGAEPVDELGEFTLQLAIFSFLLHLRSIPTHFDSRLRAHTGVGILTLARYCQPIPFLTPTSTLPALILFSTDSPSLRLQHVTNLPAKQLPIVEVSSKIATAVDEFLQQQKALCLRQQLATINAQLWGLELGNTDLHGTGNGQEDEGDLELLIRHVDTLPTSGEVRRVASSEARRLKRIHQNAEHGVVRNYAPTAASSETLERSDFLANSQSQLDVDYYGLVKVKRRLMEHLAVVRLRALIAQEAELELAKAQEVTLKKAIDEPGAGANEAETQNENASMALVKASEIPAPPRVPVPVPPQSQSLSRAKAIKAPIPLFIGPPGTGKSSLGQSITRALGRPFQRIVLGAVRDEAEIRGHRRTYVARGPGLLAQALCKADHLMAKMMTDEIDEVGQSNYHGDPSAVLLEVLDPEQNVAFNDHYSNVPIDSSQILFICTPIPSTLSHRRFSGLPPFSLPPPFPAPSETSKEFVKHSKNDGAGYNPIVEADEWRIS
ncbi:hypothetical protein V8E53_000580 [Lactarius tabidus]